MSTDEHVSGTDVLHIEPTSSPFYEMACGSTNATGRFLRMGCIGRYAYVTLRIEPLPSVKGILCENEIAPVTLEETEQRSYENYATIPVEYIPAVFAGIEQAAQSGPTYGYPVTSVRVVLIGGRFHPIDSSPATFREAGRYAFTEALRRAGTVVVKHT